MKAPTNQTNSNLPTQNLPGRGMMGWLGRQIGHVSKAMKTRVQSHENRTIYTISQTKESPLPNDPSIRLRRTIIDQVVVQNAQPQNLGSQNAQPQNHGPHAGVKPQEKP